MALTEHGGADLEGLADDGLGGPGAAVHAGADVQDGDSADHVLLFVLCGRG
jgi:hypothetical protein